MASANQRAPAYTCFVLEVESKDIISASLADQFSHLHDPNCSLQHGAARRKRRALGQAAEGSRALQVIQGLKCERKCDI